MNRSLDSLIPRVEGQPSIRKRDDKVFESRQEDEANSRAATQVNVVAASSTPPAITPIQLELFPGRACALKAKPAMRWKEASNKPARRDGVQGGGTRRQYIKTTGETLFDLVLEGNNLTNTSREAYKGEPRNRSNDVRQGVGGGHSTCETRENREEGRAATSIECLKKGKTAGLPPRGKAQSQRQSKKKPKRLDSVRKLQRTLYRVAKKQPERRFTLLYDKVSQTAIIQEAWRRVKANKGAAGVDQVSIEEVQRYGEERFLREIRQELYNEKYRVSLVRRVHIPKPGQPGKRRPLGIPTMKDRVVQMAVKIVIEPLYEADFMSCSYGFRPKRTARMALSQIAKLIQAGYRYVVDVDLKSYFDTIDHEILMQLMARRVGDKRVLRMIQAWLKAGVLEDGKISHPDRGSPQGGVISPLLSNIMLHEVDRQWCDRGGQRCWGTVVLVRYADDMILLARTADEAKRAWERLQHQFSELRLEVNQEKSRLTTVSDGFAFLGFEFQKALKSNLYMWPREKACKNIRERVREKVRSIPNNESLKVLIQQLNPVLIGWCTYFRVGNSNRIFHEIDWAVRQQVQLWLRYKYQCSWRTAQKRWQYRFLHDKCRLYRMVGKVSYLEGLRRMPLKEDGRRAGCGKSASPVR